MRARFFAVVAVLAFGCGEDPPTSYDTYQECFDDRYNDGMGELVPDALVGCCLENPIGGVTKACGATVPDCINYLTSNLSQTSASTVEKMDACAAYVDEKNNPPGE